MTANADTVTSLRRDLVSAALVVALDGAALGGVQVRARLGPARDAWLGLVQSLTADVSTSTTCHRLSASHLREALGGGLDLTATLASGRPVRRASVLAASGAATLIIGSAERLSSGDAAHLIQALEHRKQPPALIALDEGIDDEAPPAALSDRLGMVVVPDAAPPIALDAWAAAAMRRRIASARAMLADVRLSASDREALAATAAALDVASIRPLLAVVRIARCLAALDTVTALSEQHLATAIRLALLPRARRLPTPDQEPAQTPPPSSPADPTPQHQTDSAALDDVVLDAALAHLPPDVLHRLMSATRNAVASETARRGDAFTPSRHGRPARSRPGRPDQGRLDIMATLRTAAPWQRVRMRAPDAPLAIRPDDLRLKRYVKPTGTTHIFVVDASGSTALHRLAEAKGAVELLLADCYVRRDRAALIVFRGKRAELLLPPTRALARAKRALAAMAGGGGTPLAAGLLMATSIAEPLRRRNETVDVVVLTDGRANINRDGRPGRAAAEADATTAACALRAAGIACLVIDTSPRPDPAAQRLATALAATHLPLPFADARTLSNAVRLARTS